MKNVAFAQSSVLPKTADKKKNREKALPRQGV